MPDIREILSALDEQDRMLWSKHRTEIRRSYMAAHNSVHGIINWSDKDDAFIDLIDIQLALLFDRAGRFAASTDVLGVNTDKEKVIGQIEADLDTAKVGWAK